MGDFLRLLLPIFVIRSYSDMLRKLASFLFYETWVVTFVLRGIPPIDEAFSRSYGKIGSALSVIPNADKLNLIGLGVALVVAGAGYFLQLHDRASDVLGIRKRFDRVCILVPLALMVGAKLTPEKIDRLDVSRDTVMRDVFYKYASSRAENPLVDKHDIEHALSGWSWYWVFIEAILLLLVSSVVAISFGAYEMSASFVLLAMLCWLLAGMQRVRLYRYARPQVEAIAGNANAAAAVKAVFDAL